MWSPSRFILGTLLFLIYINDLPNCSQLLNYILFADDTNISMRNNDLSLLFDNMNIELKKLDSWMQANKLILNAGKTNFMIFGTRECTDNFVLYYNSDMIKRVTNTKFLGVMLDDKLSWNSHVNMLCNTLSRNIGILRKLKFLPKHVLKLLYHSFISSHLSYCTLVWGHSTKKNVKRIHLLQKKAIRIITHSHYLSQTSALFKKMNILPIQDIICFQTGIFMQQYLFGALPAPLHLQFMFSSQQQYSFL